MKRKFKVLFPATVLLAAAAVGCKGNDQTENYDTSMPAAAGSVAPMGVDTTGNMNGMGGMGTMTDTTLDTLKTGIDTTAGVKPPLL
jgi:hypothetical protein